MNALIIFQGRPLVLIIHLHAHFHSDSALYPDSSFQSDSGLSQGGTDSGLHSHSCLHRGVIPGGLGGGGGAVAPQRLANNIFFGVFTYH